MPKPQGKLAAFLAELKRRRVFRVAVVYAGVAFILCQIVDATFGSMGIPLWGERLVFALLAIGFPIAVALAWAFDLTAEGLVRAKPKREPTAAKAPHHPLVGNKALALIAMLAIVFGIWALLREPSPDGAAISSVAVLPLDNISGDPEQEYFTEGMHEAIITNLNRLSALKVISRTSAMRYKDTDKLMPQIARELGVDALVEGSVYKVGNQVRITAQLIHGASDEHLWDNEYEGDLTDILSLQKTVARAIAGEIGLALQPEEEAYLASAQAVNPEAYNLYLKGWHFRKLGDYSKAVEYLEQSVALDSTLGQAWAALAFAYMGTGGIIFGDPIVWVDSGFNLMKQTLDKALDLDPAQPDAHTYLAIYQWFKWEYVAAEASFRWALELDPDNVNALFEYGLFLARTGRPDEALELSRRAMELDPTDWMAYYVFHDVYNFIRQYEKELEFRLLRQELQGTTSTNSGTKQRILMEQGRYAEVAEQAGVTSWVGMRARMAMGNVAEVYAYRDSVRSTGELRQREKEHPFWSARFYGIMGERDKTLSLLERAYEDTTKEVNYPIGLVYYPEFDFLRAEPRFKALMQKMGLTELFDQNGQRIR